MSALLPDIMRLNSAEKVELVRKIMGTIPPEEMESVAGLLPKENRLQLVEMLLCSIPDEAIPLTEWQRKLLDERIEEYYRDPTEGQTLEEFIATNGQTP